MTYHPFRLQPRNQSRFRTLPSPTIFIKESTNHSNQEPIGRTRLDEFHKEKFWFEDPSALFSSLAILPSQYMTDAQRFNAMTRLILVIAILLFFIPVASWILFLICGVILLFLIYSLTSMRQRSQRIEPKIENYRCLVHEVIERPKQNRRKFSLIPR